MNHESRVDHLALAAFTFLLTVSLLFDLLPSYSTRLIWPQSLTMGVMLVAAVGVFFNPASPIRLAVVCGAAAATFYLRLPRVNNHEVLMLATCVLVLVALAILWWKCRGGSVPAGEFYRVVAPPLRWVVLILYFWATVHKLNTGYFDNDLSCGTMQLFNLRTKAVFGQKLDFIPTDDAARYLAIYGTLLIETLIPLLLIFRRTRLAGVGLALGFHFILGFGYAAFSAFMYALLSLFLPASFWERALRWWREAWIPRTVQRFASWQTVHTWLLVLFLCAVAFCLLHRAERPTPLRVKTIYTNWLLYSSVAMILFARLSLFVRSTARLAPVPFFRAPYRALLLIPLLVFLNGLSPHVGLKNTQSFAMFSNLRTEGGESNHMFIPASWQKSDYLNDLVTIKSSSDPYLTRLAKPSWQPAWKSSPKFSTTVKGSRSLLERYPNPTWKLPFVSLKQHVVFRAEQGMKSISVTYERNGQVREVTQAENDPELTELSYWEKKFLRLRAVPSVEEGCCMW